MKRKDFCANVMRDIVVNLLESKKCISKGDIIKAAKISIDAARQLDAEYLTEYSNTAFD